VRFLQWKASVFYWIAGIIFVGSVWIGKQPLLERLMAKALPEGVSVSASTWRSTSVLLGGFYILLGVVNIWVALNRSEADWVFFKVWIAGPAGIVFTLGLVVWMFRDLIFSRENPS
jgi:intracellular septation protein